MRIDVKNTTRQKVPFHTLDYGEVFIEDESDFKVDTGEMMLIKCATGTDEIGDKFNAVYPDDGSLTYVQEDKEVYRVNARIEVEF